MRRACALLLRLYPAEHRELFRGEMLTLIEELAAEHHARGRAVFFWFSLRELVGLVCGGGWEWMAKCGRSRRYLDSVPSGEERLAFLIRRIEFAIAHHEFVNARYYAEEERREREKFQKRCN
jgi:hypothetical protein